MHPARIRQLAGEALDSRRPHVAVATLAERLDGRDIGIHGHGALALLDERALRTLRIEPFENFVAVPAINYLKATVRRSLLTHPTAGSGNQASGSFTEAWPGAGADSDYLPGRTIGAVYLSDSTAAENAGTETYLPGTIIGAAHPSTTAQLANRGGHVPGSSTRSPTSAVHRFEWGTTQANGTIGSVGWAADIYTARAAMPWLSRPIASPAGWLWQFPEHPALNDFSSSAPTNLRTLAVRQSDGLTLGCAVGTATVTQLNTSPFTRVTTSTIPTATSAYGTASAAISDMAIDGTDLWFTQSASPYSIRKETLGALGSATATFTKPWAAAVPGLIAASGSHLYVAESASVGTTTRTIYKLNPATGAVVSSWTHDLAARGGVATGASLHSLVWDYANGLLGVIDSSGDGTINGANGATCWRSKVTWYDASGNVVYVSGVNGSEAFSGTGRWQTIDATAASGSRGAAVYSGLLLVTALDAASNTTVRLYQVANLGTRTRLGAPVTKTSANALRCDYSFTFS